MARSCWRFLCLIVLGAAPAAAAPADEVVVVAPTPLRGSRLDADKLPGVVESIGADAFARTGSLAVTDTLQRLAGASLSDSQGNPFARDFDFRGFAASPLQGTPQGLAVYMGDVRLNEPFGDTVNWDLVPGVAIQQADLFTANPAFGLNAIGGAVSLKMKTGRDVQGAAGAVQGGSFGRMFASAEQGLAGEAWSLYLAAEGGHDAGWRRHSPSSLGRAYADLGWSRGRSELHLVLAAAADRLGVIGPTPVDLLNQDPAAVFTFPQQTWNKSALVALSGAAPLGGGWALQGEAHWRLFNQHHLDGNAGDFEGCSGRPTNPRFATLCVEDEALAAAGPPASAFQVLGADGTAIGCPPLVAGQSRPCDGVPYGVIDRTRTDARAWGLSLQATRDATLIGRGNSLAMGAILDVGSSRFSADSTLALVRPDLKVDPAASMPGAGQLIHTAGAVAYTPVEVGARTTHLGLYATDTWDAGERLSLTLSGRWNRAGESLRDLTGVSPALNGEHVFTRFNVAAGLALKLARGVTGYAGYAEANRAPTALELGCSDPARPCLLENALVSDPPLKQVRAGAWEAGLRGADAFAGARLRWRVGLFQVDNRDDILALASAIQGRGYFANVPRTRRRGLETSWELSGRSWMAYLGYSHIEATYRFAGLIASPNSPFADSNGDIGVRMGDRIGGIPADRLKLGGELGLGAGLKAGADAVMIGPQPLVGDESNQDRPLPGYWSLALHASWTLRGGVELFGRIDNLLDSRRATYGTYFDTGALANLDPSPLPADPDPRTLTLLAPRAIQAGLRARW